MRVVYMGTPEFSVSPLVRLVEDGYQVVAVYTQPDRAAGRGRAPGASAVKKTALARGLPLLQPPSLKCAGIVEELAGLRPDMVVVAAFGQILPPAVLDVPALGCVNIHPSLLPRYRGTSPVQAAILAGERFAGVSIMLMDAGMDTGPVLSRGQVQIAPSDTGGSLAAKLSLVAAQMLLDVLPRLERGALVPQPQDESAATYTRMVRKEDGEIDWSMPAVEIWRRVRAFQPWPGCFTSWRGRQLKVIEALPVPAEVTESPEEPHCEGEVVGLPGGEAPFGVVTGEDVLGVVVVQLEGKKAMTGADFLRGQRDLIGSVLPS